MKTKLITFITALLPGAGHMYLGMMRRGVQLMILFFAPIMIASFFRSDAMLFFLPVIWFYSFFDALNRRSSQEAMIDDDIPVVKWIIDNKSISKNNSKTIAYGLIIIGGYLLFDRLFMMSIYYFGVPYFIRLNIQTSFLAIIFLIGGIFLLKGKKTEVKEDNAPVEIKVD